MMKCLNVNKLPNGINTIVEFTYSGYNQEDSVILNKGAIEGLLWLHFTEHISEEKSIKSLKKIYET